MPWRSWRNAEIYDRFVRERPIYQWLNRQLVERAAIATASRILDLGCGTGATTLACLERMAARAEIVGIDSSEEMIGVARANVHDPRARFEVRPAREAAELPGTFDRVVCNAAFWQFPSADAVLGTLAACTGPGARFVFNIPAERAAGEPSPIHPFQVALMREIEAASGERFEGQATVLDLATLASTAGSRGFHLAAIQRASYEGRQEELMELMSIPAMIGPLTPGFDDDRRDAVLEAARQRSEADLPVSVPWLYVILEREPAARNR